MTFYCSAFRKIRLTRLPAYSFRVPMLCAAIGQGESLVTMPEISGSHSVSRNPLVKQWIRRVNEACLRKCQQNGAPIPSGPREKADDLM